MSSDTRVGYRHAWTPRYLAGWRKWWWESHSEAFLHYHGVITEGVPPSWWYRVAFKPPPRSKAYRTSVDGRAAW